MAKKKAAKAAVSFAKDVNWLTSKPSAFKRRYAMRSLIIMTMLALLPIVESARAAQTNTNIVVSVKLGEVISGVFAAYGSSLTNNLRERITDVALTRGKSTSATEVDRNEFLRDLKLFSRQELAPEGLGMRFDAAVGEYIGVMMAVSTNENDGGDILRTILTGNSTNPAGGAVAAIAVIRNGRYVDALHADGGDVPVMVRVLAPVDYPHALAMAIRAFENPDPDQVNLAAILGTAGGALGENLQPLEDVPKKYKVHHLSGSYRSPFGDAKLQAAVAWQAEDRLNNATNSIPVPAPFRSEPFSKISSSWLSLSLAAHAGSLEVTKVDKAAGAEKKEKIDIPLFVTANWHPWQFYSDDTVWNAKWDAVSPYISLGVRANTSQFEPLVGVGVSVRFETFWLGVWGGAVQVEQESLRDGVTRTSDEWEAVGGLAIGVDKLPSF